MITYIGKVGELSLKGSNIKQFQNALIRNTKTMLEGIKANISLSSGRLYVECEDSETEKVEEALCHLVGITGYARTYKCKKTLEAICNTAILIAKNAIEEYKKLNNTLDTSSLSFKIEARREDKTFILTSYELSCKVGDAVIDACNLKVNVHNPVITIYIEVRKECYLYTQNRKANQGLPVGTSEKALVLLSGGLDSPVAAIRMIKRGMSIDAVYFHSYPYTTEEALIKVQDLTKVISRYGIRVFLNTISFTEVQTLIKDSVEDEWDTLMLRICMVKASCLLAKQTHALALVTGESLGQVASQTLENLNLTASYSSYPILRPLIAFNKDEIILEAKEYKTYDISIRPYPDCCVLFSPRHPILRGNIEDAAPIYNKINYKNQMDDLIKEALEKREVQEYVCGKEIKRA